MLSAEVRAPLRAIDLDASLSVAPGSCLALAGPSGAGKTSMLHAIAGLLRPSDGVISCGGLTWFDGATGRSVRPEQRRCGVVFQDYALFPHMSAWRNVAYGLRGLRRSERRLKAVELLDRFGIAALTDARPAELSGGERQRVALARALAVDPSALLLDEPLSALDRASADAASRELSAVLREAEVPCVLVTHDFAQASLLADEVAVMDRGSIVQRGSAADLAASPASAFVAELTGASVLRGVARPGAAGTCELTLPGGATVVAIGAATGPAAVVLRPWDVTIESASPAGPASSARNHVAARVTGLVPLGGRVRVALALPEPLAAEITAQAAESLALRPGAEVRATWKATAGRLVPGLPARQGRS